MLTHKTFNISIVAILFITSFMPTFTGCGNSGNFGYVSGKVLIDGQAAPEGLIVRFQPVDKNGSPSSSFTGKNGEYELWFSRTVKGVQLGSSTVTIIQQTSDTEVKPTPEYLLAFNEKREIFDVKKGRQTYDVNIDSSLKLDKKKKKR
ncbi:MAG: hypothetical protein LBT05_14105 [Planctomycetaceae bacterium]|jgi:hypothetical protein|nr:hypothetical protein [Planctomycetaceae bacterium]